MLQKYLFLVFSCLLSCVTTCQAVGQTEFGMQVGSTHVSQTLLLGPGGRLECLPIQSPMPTSYPSEMWLLLRDSGESTDLRQPVVELCHKTWQSAFENRSTQEELDKIVAANFPSDEILHRVECAYARSIIERFGFTFVSKANNFPAISSTQLAEETIDAIKNLEIALEQHLSEITKKLNRELFRATKESLSKEQAELLSTQLDVLEGSEFPIELLYWQLCRHSNEASLFFDEDESDAQVLRSIQFRFAGDGKLELMKTASPAILKANAPSSKLARLLSEDWNKYLELTEFQLSELANSLEGIKERRKKEEPNRGAYENSKEHFDALMEYYSNLTEEREVGDILDSVLIDFQTERLQIMSDNYSINQVGLLNCLEFGELGRRIKVTESQKMLLSRIRDNGKKECEQALRNLAGTHYKQLTKLLADYEDLHRMIPSQQVDKRLPIVTLPFLFRQSKQFRELFFQ